MSENVEKLGASLKRFGITDYTVFILMLVACSCVGLYFGYKDHKESKHRKKKGSEALNYLLGGRNIQVFPGA